MWHLIGDVYLNVRVQAFTHLGKHNENFKMTN